MNLKYFIGIISIFSGILLFWNCKKVTRKGDHTMQYVKLYTGNPLSAVTPTLLMKKTVYVSHSDQHTLQIDGYTWKRDGSKVTSDTITTVLYGNWENDSSYTFYKGEINSKENEIKGTYTEMYSHFWRYSNNGSSTTGRTRTYSEGTFTISYQ